MLLNLLKDIASPTPWGSGGTFTYSILCRNIVQSCGKCNR
jgi:hypothetical protein